MVRAFQPHLLLLLAASLALFNIAFAIDQAFQWTDPWEGMINAIWHFPLVGIVWILYGLLPGLLVYGVYRWRGWRRFRALAITAPGIAACLLVVGAHIRHPATPAARFKQFAKADLPASARDLKTHFTGGGVADFGDTYYFRCSPADTYQLIQSLQLHPARPDSFKQFRRISRDWPDSSTWPESTLYEGKSEDGIWFYYLLTDSSWEQVYVHLFCL